jgi:hypothetical protein
MGSKMPPSRVWKRTPNFITHEPVEQVLMEICEQTSWQEDDIRKKLFESKLLIRVPGARYHIYRDSLG